MIINFFISIYCKDFAYFFTVLFRVSILQEKNYNNV